MSGKNQQILKGYQKNCRKAKKSTKNFFFFFSLRGIKIEQKVLIFDKQCINKNAFHKNKRPVNIDRVEIRRIELFKKDSYGKKGSFKFFIGYINKTDALPIPLCIKLPQMNEYVKYFDSNNKCMNLLVQ